MTSNHSFQFYRSITMALVYAGVLTALGILTAPGQGRAEPITSPLVPGDFEPALLPAGTIEGTGFLSQVFTIPGAGIITFDVNLLTGEPDPIPPGTCCNDYLGYGLFEPGGLFLTPLILAPTVGVLDIPLTDFPSPVFGPHGEVYLRESGVFPALLVVPGALGGQSARLGIGVFELVDSGVDTGAIIDNIFYPPGTGGDFMVGPGPYFGALGGSQGSFHSLTIGGAGDFDAAVVDKSGFLDGYVHISTGPGVSVVPEPASLLLLTSGLAGLAGWRWRQARLTNTSQPHTVHSSLHDPHV